MTDTWVPPPWEPPFAGTEAEQLLGALDRQRATFRWKADGLDAAGLAQKVGASALTLGGLLKHLALVEDDLFGGRMLGEPMDGAVWGGWDGPGWEFRSAGDDTPAHLYALYDGAVERSRARVARFLETGAMDSPVNLTGPDDAPVFLRRLVCDFLEEYGRHTGQADLLREAVDGRVGEDPPGDWRPSPA